MSDLPGRLREIVEDFSYCEGQEKLEFLLEFSESLKPLPVWLNEERSHMDEVHECMTPVFMYAENQDGHLYYHFDIPPESPTVRGFAAILQQGMGGLTPEEVAAVPNDFYFAMGLQNVLSGQRLNGIGAILAHMQNLARKQ